MVERLAATGVIAAMLVTLIGWNGTGLAEESSSLTGVVWRLDAIESAAGDRLEPELPLNYTVTFGADDTVAIMADCNTGGGEYVTGTDGSLTFGPIRLTMMACEQGSLDGVFAAALQDATTVNRTGNDLVIGTTGGGVIRMTVSIGDTVWQWQGTDARRGSSIIPPDTARYTVVFRADALLAVQVDCNQGFGHFVLRGTSIRINSIATTLMACPDGTLDGAFLAGLHGALTYSLTGEGLNLNLANGDTMRFTAESLAMATPAP